MGLIFKKYKTKFRYSLKPVFAMLASRQKEMNSEEWMVLTQRTCENILKNPIDFLGTDLPEKDLTRDIVDEIFSEFHHDLRIRKINHEDGI
jgi:hypothetical protein